MVSEPLGGAMVSEPLVVPLWLSPFVSEPLVDPAMFRTDKFDERMLTNGLHE